MLALRHVAESRLDVTSLEYSRVQRSHHTSRQPVRHQARHFRPVAITSSEQRIQQNSMKRDVFQENSHSQVSVVGQVVFADFQEATVNC